MALETIIVILVLCILPAILFTGLVLAVRATDKARASMDEMEGRREKGGTP